MEPVGAVAVWSVFWWCDAQGAADGGQPIIHTVKTVVHIWKITQEMFNFDRSELLHNYPQTNFEFYLSVTLYC